MWIKIIIIFLIIINISFAEMKGYIEAGRSIEDRFVFSEIGLKYNHKVWKLRNELYGGVLTWAEPADNWNSFRPYRVIYTFGSKAVYKNWYVRYRHFCNHAVYSSAIHKEKTDWLNNRWGDTMTSISIGLEF